MADKIATLHLPEKSRLNCRSLSGTVGPDVIDVRKLGTQGYFTFDPGFMATGSANLPSPSMATPGCLAAPRLPHRPVNTRPATSKSATHPALRRGPSQDPAMRNLNVWSPATPWCRQIAFFFAASPRRPPHGRHVRRGQRAVRLLSRRPRHQQRGASRICSLPSALSKMPTLAAMCYQVLHRPALLMQPPQGKQRSLLCRQLPAHDV